MLKKVLLLFLLSFSTSIFSQKNEIKIFSENLDTYGAVYLKAKKSDNYIFQIKNINKVIFEKNILIKGKTGIKYDFRKLKSGNYTFSILKGDKIIYSKNVLKK